MNIRQERPSRAHTKIVATVGPGSDDCLAELIDAGMSVARINFSHGTHADHRRRIAELRRLASEKEVALGILADIRGPKLRLGTFPEGELRLEVGSELRLRGGNGMAAPGEALLDLPEFRDALEIGHRVFLADGAVELVVERTEGEAFVARTTRGGLIGDRKGVHLPDSELLLEVPTAEDRRDLELVRELEVDFVGVSFVAQGSELDEVRKLAPGAAIVAKIERAVALENLKEILEATDGIMVARGDLGVEAELEHLPMIQKSLLQSGLLAGKFTITATEMLESMVESSRPTRAEVTDVANAILDGTDALMLSAETAVGKNPVAAVETMGRIARAVEASQGYSDLPRVAFRASEPTFSNGMALAASHAAAALGLGKIICFTETGNTVRLLSRYRPHSEVIALSPHRRTLAHVAILAHVRPLWFPHCSSLEDMLEQASELLLERRMVGPGEEVVFVAGVPPGVARSTNVLKLHRIGDSINLA
jgi:pyruvate kinase